jgi:5-methylcytosine-specific restriction endonuclease McrA
MKRSTLKRKSAMRRISKKRAGTSEGERQALKDLHREAVMVRWGIGEFPQPPRKDGTPRAPSWRGACPRCGNDRWLQCSHIYPVGKYPNSRYDPDNAIPLCMGCHIFWWHKNPIDARAWIETKIGAETLSRLEMRVKSASRPDPNATLLYLEAEIRRLRAGPSPSA